ncbi:MAG TPA: helix-turn-helix domain-containing protein [Candidatus Polarisedimenticolia bacterium]|nr:helix-turn-helix domain-containing protein [Candidatus Polarisedimenticolia bacterium]
MGRIGQTLKQARELREIDLREISDATKINIRYLEAIETNRFEVLPGGVFNKGFIRAYANYIGLDGQAMVDNYVHDLEAGADDPSDPGPPPPGLHRPNAIPQRRVAAAQPGEAKSAAGHDIPAAVPDHERAPIHLTSLLEFPRQRREIPPAGGEPNILPRIAWLIAATGVVFCILAAWRYVADDPRPPLDTGQAQMPLPSAAGPPPVTRTPGGDAGEEPRLAGPIAPAVDESPSAGSGATVVSPPPGSTPPVSDAGTAADPPRPAPVAADDRQAPDLPVPRPPVTGPDPPAPLPPPQSLADEDADAGLRILITARRATRVRVVCDGREAADREMQPGETASLSCAHLIRLSAPDASSIQLLINGSECLPLGAPGSRLFGYVIRADDYQTLCPGRTEGVDVPS